MGGFYVAAGFGWLLPIQPSLAVLKKFKTENDDEKASDARDVYQHKWIH